MHDDEPMQATNTTQLGDKIRQAEEQRRSTVKREETTILLLRFALGDEQYALRAHAVGSVEVAPRIVQLPGTPPFLLGVVNLQSEIVAVVGLKEFLGLPLTADSGKRLLIVVSHQDDKVAFLVDEVLDAVEVAESAMEEPISTLDQSQSRFLEGETRLNGHLVGVLDIGVVMASQEMQNSRGL